MKILERKEKGKAYNKALEIAKKNYDAAQDLCEGSQIGVECFKDTLANIFPELKEPGDEEVRGAIIHFISHTPTVPKGTINKKTMLTWLEKQGEKEQDARYKDLEELLAADDIYQMAMNDEMVREAKEKAVNALHGMCIGRLLGIEKQGEQNLIMAKSPQLGEQKPADKVEPKFKVGDKIRRKTPSSCDKDMQVARIEKDYYICNHIGKFSSEVVPFSKESRYELVEQKSADKVEPKDFNGIDPHFGKPADKAEPKFRVRDWIVRDGKILQISHIDKVLDGTFHYWFTKGTWLSSAKMEDAHLWTIEDAKDGDVLADNLGVILFKSIRDNNVINYYAYLSGLFAVQKDEEYWGYAVNCTLSPATKEQRERFFAAMHDAGYEWDAEKRELKKIEQKQEENKRNLGGFSSNWSEEDENEVAILEAYIRSKDWSESHIGRALGIVNELVNKCKSSKDRVQPKQEWSEEDEKLTNSIEAWLDTLCDYLKDSSPERVEDVKDVMGQFKSLKQRHTWKPSEEQMKALADALSLAKNCGEEGAFDLRTLHEQLEKL